MKKLTIVAMVVLAAILVASPVLAAGSSHPMEVAKQGPRKKPTSISMTGTITAINARNSKTVFEVLVQKTNKPFIILKNQSVDVEVDNSTKCVEWVSGKKSKVIDCGSLGPKSKVSIIGTVVNRDPWTFKARRVQLKQPRIQH